MVNVLPVLAEAGDVRIVDVGGQQLVVTARDLARALGYRQEWAVHNLYNRNKESFTERDVGVIKMMTPSGEQWVRYFTKRGALKVCMKSNQPKAIQVQELLIDLFEQVERGRLVPVQQFNALAQQVDRLAQQLSRVTGAMEQQLIRLDERTRKIFTELAHIRHISNFQNEAKEDAVPTPVLYIDRRRRPWRKSTDEPILQYIAQLAREYPGFKASYLIDLARGKAQKEGWRIGSRATLYRIIKMARQPARMPVYRDAWIDIKDAALFLGLPESVVLQHVKTGKLEGLEVNGANDWIISLSSLKRMMH